MIKPLTLILLLSVLAMSALTYKQFQTLKTTKVADIQSEANTKLPEVASHQPLAIPPLSDYQEITERPLFSQSRRPEENAPEVQAAPKQPTRKPDLKLTGIVLSDGEQIALISKKRDPKIERVKVGDQVDGWKISEISPLNVVITAAGENITLDLLRKSDPNAVKKLQQSRNTPGPSAPGATPSPPAPGNPESFPHEPDPFGEELPEDF